MFLRDVEMSEATTRPKTARRSTRKAETTRNEILMAAADLFAEKGYSECNLRELAERVGMKAGSFYYHFRSKEEILDELLLASIALVTEEVRKAIAGAGPDAPLRDRIAAAMRAHVRTFLSREEGTSAFMRVWEHMPPAMKWRKRESRREYAAIWYELVEDGIREGLIRDDIAPDVLVPYLIGSMSRALEWFSPRHMTIEQVCDAVVKMHLDGGLTPGSRIGLSDAAE